MDKKKWRQQQHKHFLVEMNGLKGKPLFPIGSSSIVKKTCAAADCCCSTPVGTASPTRENTINIRVINFAVMACIILQSIV